MYQKKRFFIDLIEHLAKFDSILIDFDIDHANEEKATVFMMMKIFDR